jgi:hypothetical protein
MVKQKRKGITVRFYCALAERELMKQDAKKAGMTLRQFILNRCIYEYRSKEKR